MTPDAPVVARVAGFEVAHRNEEEFRLLRAEVFDDEEYAFDFAGAAPRILDCGSHVGLSVLYFKRRWPQARVTAFEPDPGNFALLVANLARNRVAGVEAVQAAVVDRDGEVEVYGEFGGEAPWTWDLSVLPDLWRKGRPQEIRRVRAVRLSRWLDQPADFVKLDVEGAEERVIDEIAARLSRVREMSVEVHPGNRPDGVSAVDGERIAAVLREAGFALEFVRGAVKKPYLIRARRV